MAHGRAEATRSQLIQGNDIYEACTVVECNPGGENLITVTCFRNGVVDGSPFRLKVTESGQWAAEYPGLNDRFVVGADGHPADG